jgi:hypothetical protein
MSSLDKLITFNALHILLIILISNIIINSSLDLDSVLNGFYYVLSMEPLGFWFLMIHIIIAYIMLISVKIELGFHAAITFNL